MFESAAEVRRAFGMSAERKTGTIKFYLPAKGYGFITTDDYRNVFVHISNWLEDDDPRRDERVTFVERAGREGKPVAHQVTRANGKREDFIRSK